jgi:hypothetical protein
MHAMTSDAVTPEPDSRPQPGDITLEPLAGRRFDAEPYRITGPAPLAGMLLLIIALPAAGLAIGLLTSYIAQWLYLVILFPFAMGALAGGVGWVLVRVGKAHTPAILWSATVLTALATILGLHFGHYLRALNAAEQQVPGVLARGISDPSMFGRYIDNSAEEGVTIARRHRRGDKSLNLGYVGSYIYWAAEAGFIGYVLFLILRSAAQASLCEHCRRWKNERLLGQLPEGPPDLFGGSLLDGNLLTLLEHTTAAGQEGLVLKAAICPSCKAEATVDIALVEVTRNSKGYKRTRQLDRVRYPGDVLAFLDAPSKPA